MHRVEVTDDHVYWSKNLSKEEYKPIEHTDKSVLLDPKSGKAPVWADPSNPTMLPFNQIKDGIDRQSYVSSYQQNGVVPESRIYNVDEKNRPKNPMGRTGMAGRGLLGKWGPNHAADAIDSKMGEDGKLEYVTILRGDNKIPGGMLNKGEDAEVACLREFKEEASMGTPEVKLEQFKGTGDLIYKGYVDDHRNTDNSWMETTAYNYHNNTELMKLITLKAGDDAEKVKYHSGEGNARKARTQHISGT